MRIRVQDLDTGRWHVLELVEDLDTGEWRIAWREPGTTEPKPDDGEDVQE